MAGDASVTEACALCGVSPLRIPPLVCKTQLRSPAYYNAAHLCQDCQEIAAFRTGCHGLPRDVGSMTAVPRCDWICTLRSAGLGDEMDMLFECEALCDLREEHADLFQGVLSVKKFMWQHNMSDVAVYVDKCLTRNEAALVE